MSQGPGSRLDRAECSRFAVFYRKPPPRRAPEPRAQNRLGWAGLGWAGLGWLGLQNAVCSVPEDSVPFGRGPAGCGCTEFHPLGTRPRCHAYARLAPRGVMGHRSHLLAHQSTSAPTPRCPRAPYRSTPQVGARTEPRGGIQPLKTTST